jgi:lysophospholipid acyltransferase (LPLAT)-like uncharacterized protein
MLKEFSRRPAVQAWLAGVLGRYLAFALHHTRWTLEGEEHLARGLADGPVVAAVWHERLPLLPALLRPARVCKPGLAVHVLASRHHDGRLIGEVMRHLGVGVVHGSTMRNGQDKGGAAALRALIGVLRGGAAVVVTPDGPRGPRRQAAAGVAQLAALAGVPVLPCAAQTARRWVFGTWDRMVLPLPWGRGVLVCGAPIEVPRHGYEATLPAIAAALTAAADRADALCREVR